MTTQYLLFLALYYCIEWWQIEFSTIQGNVLKDIVIWSGYICGTKGLESFPQQDLVEFFFFISTWNKKHLLQTMLAMYSFRSENIFLRKLYIKKMQFRKSLPPYKKCVKVRTFWETHKIWKKKSSSWFWQINWFT